MMRVGQQATKQDLHTQAVNFFHNVTPEFCHASSVLDRHSDAPSHLGSLIFCPTWETVVLPWLDYTKLQPDLPLRCWHSYDPRAAYLVKRHHILMLLATQDQVYIAVPSNGGGAISRRNELQQRYPKYQVRVKGPTVGDGTPFLWLPARHCDRYQTKGSF